MLKHSPNKAMYDRMRARRARIMKRQAARRSTPDKVSGLRGHWNGITEASSQLKGGYPVFASIVAIILTPVAIFAALFGVLMIFDVMSKISDHLFG